MTESLPLPGRSGCPALDRWTAVVPSGVKKHARAGSTRTPMGEPGSARPATRRADRDARLAEQDLDEHLVTEGLDHVHAAGHGAGGPRGNEFEIPCAHAHVGDPGGRAGAVPVAERDVAACDDDARALRVERHVEDVHRRVPHELGDEPVRRAVEHLLRRCVLLDATVVEQADPVRHRERLDLVVRHVDRGRAEPLLEALDLRAHRHAQLRVEVGQRLVHEERGRFADDRPGEGDPLALPAGELARSARQEVVHLEGARDPQDGVLPLPRVDLAHLERVGDVLGHGQVGVQGVALEDHGDVTASRRAVRHVLPGDDHAAGGRAFQACDDPQRRRLAAARRSEQHDELAVLDAQVEVLQDADGVELLADPGQDHLTHCVHPWASSGPGRWSPGRRAGRAAGAGAGRAGARAPRGSAAPRRPRRPARRPCPPSSAR